jgi:hypothetical protein
MQCPLYADLRQKMSNDVLHFNAIFFFLSDVDKFVFLFSNENVYVTKNFTLTQKEVTSKIKYLD